jgi:cytochrome c
MTSFDTYCFLTTIDMREAELEAMEKAKANQSANQLSSPGDSAKGAKLFEVSSFQASTVAGNN